MVSPSVLALAALVVATTTHGAPAPATDALQARIVLEPGMHPIKAPYGTQVLRRETPSDQTSVISYPHEYEPDTMYIQARSSVDEGADLERRIVLRPGMHPVKTPPGMHILRRDTSSDRSATSPLDPTRGGTFFGP